MPAIQELPSATEDRTIESLERVSRELDATYRDLEGRMARLNQELEASRNERLRELAEKERLLNRMSSLMAVLPGGVLLVDAKGRIRDANPMALTLLGDDIIGRDWPDVEASVSTRAAANSHRDQQRQLSITSSDLDRYAERVILITDTTELHNLQAKLGHQRRLTAMGEMSARLAHQIRTPLSSTVLYLSRLRDPKLAPERRSTICDQLVDRLGHMETLVNSMLSFVRGERGSRAAFNVQDLLADLRSLVKNHIEEAGAQLTITPVDRTLTIEAAPEELVGALGNLVVNAIENGGDRVQIKVWVGAASRDELLIKVSDSGPGLDDDIIERIFDPFFTTRATGTGLGLAVVARTIAEHNGSIVAANAANGGAEFEIRLPLLKTIAAGASRTVEGAQ